MRKNILTKLTMILAAFTIVFTAGTAVSASDDNVCYSYNIKANAKETYTTSRYRQTKKTYNPWKVDFAWSGEGAGTKTTYYLALYNSEHEAASNEYTIKQGTGAHYYNAFSNASQKNVCLAMKNNNYNSSTYYVSGYWDEETY